MHPTLSLWGFVEIVPAKDSPSCPSDLWPRVTPISYDQHVFQYQSTLFRRTWAQDHGSTLFPGTCLDDPQNEDNSHNHQQHGAYSNAVGMHISPLLDAQVGRLRISLVCAGATLFLCRLDARGVEEKPTWLLVFDDSFL
jgi:hypothetical protein